MKASALEALLKEADDEEHEGAGYTLVVQLVGGLTYNLNVRANCVRQDTLIGVPLGEHLDPELRIACEHIVTARVEW